MFKAHYFLALVAIVTGQNLEQLLPYPDVYPTIFNPAGGHFQLVDCHPRFSSSFYGVDPYYQTGYPYEVTHRHPSLEWYPEVREVQNPEKQFSFTVKLSEKKRNKEVMARPTKKVVQKPQSDPELVGAVNPAAMSQDNHPDIPMDDKTFDKICDKIKLKLNSATAAQLPFVEGLGKKEVPQTAIKLGGKKPNLNVSSKAK